MNPLDIFRFSAGGLRGHRLRTALSLLGVAIGVSSVIMLTSLGEGARLYVTGQFASLGTNLIIVMPGKTETAGMAPFVSSAPNDLTVDDTEALVRRVPQIRRIAPVCLGTGPAKQGERSRDVTVIGSTHAISEIRQIKIGIGRFLPPEERDAPVCVIGAKIQRELFGNQNPLGGILRIGGTRFRVIGVMAPKGTSIGLNQDEVVYVPVETAMRIFNRTSLFRVLVEVSSSREMESTKRAIAGVLKERHDGERSQQNAFDAGG